MSLKTWLNEPIIHNPRTYTTFNLDAKVWSSDFRLSNVGSTASAATQYIDHLGVLALIHDIEVHQDNVLISRLRDSQQWLAFHQLMKTNRNNRGLENYLLGSHWGFEKDDDELVEKTAGANNVDTTEAATFKGRIKLNMISNFLKENPILPKKLNKLRLTIYWEQDRDNIYGPAAPTVTDILRPVLIADEILDPALVAMSNKIESMKFRAIESEYHVLPANGAAAQNFSKLFKGCMNKVVRRCLLVTQPATRNTELGLIESYQMAGETIDFVVNGAEKFPYKINSVARKLEVTQDAFGELNIPTFTNYDSIADAIRDELLSNAATRALQSNLSYFGFKVNERINELRLVYHRDAGAAGNQRDPANLILFYEVDRALLLTGEAPTMAYL